MSKKEKKSAAVDVEQATSPKKESDQSSNEDELKVAPVVSKQAQQLKDLIAKGKEKGFLTYSEVNDHLPNGIVDPEQIEDIVNMINDMGISVFEKAPDSESHF